jgi:hypothetical protein
LRCKIQIEVEINQRDVVFAFNKATRMRRLKVKLVFSEYEVLSAEYSIRG